MPASFQPKFVDMVRNYTSTSGTANFVLGTAVPGFQSLGAALGAGDQFFYCVMGIDKPVEREVGRGTLMPNGTVAREAIGGPATNFSSGAKTIAVVVAAEYYDLLRQQIAGGASDLSGLATSNKTSLVAALNEVAAGAGGAPAPTFAAASGATISGNQIVTAGHAEAGKGSARYVYSAAVDAAYVAANPRSAFIAAGGRGFRIDRAQPVTPQMLGAKGDGTSDDLAALQAWLDLGGDLFLPADHFYSSAKLIARKNVNVRGAGYSFDRRQTTVGAMAGARIRFAAGVGGIQVQNFAGLASGETVLSNPPSSVDNATVQEGATLSSFRDFHLISDSNGAGAGIGFDSRVVVHVENVTARQFGGEGFVIQASADLPDAPVPYGNAALSTLRACHAIQCGSHGFWQRGRDAGPVHYDTSDAILCGGWGYLDESSYGAKYTNCHAATNSAGAYKATSLISGSVYDNCYAESGVGSNSDLPQSCTIIGGLLSTENNGNINPYPAGRIGFSKATMQMFKAVKGETNGAAAYPVVAAAYYYHHTALGAVVAGSGASNDITLVNTAGTTVANVAAGGTRWNAAVGFSVAGTPVVGARGAAVADATDAASAITQLNALLARCRAHGLIA